MQTVPTNAMLKTGSTGTGCNSLNGNSTGNATVDVDQLETLMQKIADYADDAVCIYRASNGSWQAYMEEGPEFCEARFLEVALKGLCAQLGGVL